MIALVPARDAVSVNEAAKRGVFAYIVDGDAAELQSAIDITLRRFAEYQLGDLFGADGWLADDRCHPRAPDKRSVHFPADSFSWQALQSVTPRKVHMRQMKVPHPSQG